jgi:hypothetical protein
MIGAGVFVVISRPPKLRGAGAILPPYGRSRKPENPESIKMIGFDTAGNMREVVAELK